MWVQIPPAPRALGRPISDRPPQGASRLSGGDPRSPTLRWLPSCQPVTGILVVFQAVPFQKSASVQVREFLV